MAVTVFTNATLVLLDRLLTGAEVIVDAGRIVYVALAGVVGHPDDDPPEVIDLSGMYLAPGFVDLHVHGGDGADFMDGTAEAFRTVCRCHARHGTTSLTPTSTVASCAGWMHCFPSNPMARATRHDRAKPSASVCAPNGPSMQRRPFARAAATMACMTACQRCPGYSSSFASGTPMPSAGICIDAA